MNRNTQGGKKYKSQARNVSRVGKTLRLAKEKGEIYAQVQKYLGDGRCHVQTLQGEKMMLNIRGKFRGKNKKDNFVQVGTWVLVGVRDWETPKIVKDGFMTSCDLEFVYSESDKQTLMSTVNENWQIFLKTSKKEEGSENIIFSNNNEEQYNEVEKQKLPLLSLLVEEDEINMDEI